MRGTTETNDGQQRCWRFDCCRRVRSSPDAAVQCQADPRLERVTPRHSQLVRRGGCLDVFVYGAACTTQCNGFSPTSVAACLSLIPMQRGSGCRPCTLAVLCCVSTNTAFMPDMSIITPSFTSLYSPLCARSRLSHGSTACHTCGLWQVVGNKRTSECPPPRTDSGKPRAAAKRTTSATCVSSARST